MLIEDVRVALRLREPWEAVDWGFRMVRSWWRPIGAAWLAVFGPIALGIALLAPSPGWAALLLWWLKPLFDRVVLHVISRGVFGPVPTWTDTLAALPALLGRSGLARSLVPLRLSAQRALLMPVLQLEGLRGRAYAKRARTVSGRDSSTALGLTFVCSATEFLVAFGAAALFSNLVADPADPGPAESLQDWLQGPLLAHWLPFYAAAITLVEPFYVAGGFGLYLNRRIELEGWDIEVQFRRIAQRHARAGAALALAAAVIGLGLGAPAAARAEPAAAAAAAEPLRCAPDAPEAARKCLERVLAAPEFATHEPVKQWRPRPWLVKLVGRLLPDSLGPLPDGSAWARTIEWLAAALRALVWIGLGAAAVALAVWLVRHWRARRRARADEDPDPAGERRGSSDAAAPAWPADPIGAALERFAADPTAALGLLYAVARAHAIARLGVVLAEGATERECDRACAARARAANRAPIAEDFSALTRSWVHCAYAHRPPSAAAFRQLCERWRAHLVAA